MQKTIIIGIGGTGLTAIREIRRLIAERYEQGLKAPEVGSVKFLYIDTDVNDETGHTWNVLGKDIRLTPAEKLIITGNLLGDIVQNQENYGDINAWLPTIRDYIGQPGPGAKGIRPYGRLIYEYAENKNKVQTILTNTYNGLNQSFTQGEWRFYLICGLSGGTGSGMFLPLSFDLIKWNLYQKGNVQNKFYSFLIAPPLAITGRHERYHANAFAVFKELNYYPFTEQGLPYDNCYLLEPKNVTLEVLPLLIAQRLFLNIQGGNAAKIIDSIMDNPTLGNSETDPITGDKHAFTFSTFGISSITYPKETVYQCLAYQLAFTVVFSWSNPTNYPQNVNERVRAELDSIRLSKSHCLGDSDQFGNQLQNTHEIEIENQVEENLRDVKSRELAKNAERIRKELEEGFRDKGINGYYKQLNDDLKGAIKVAIETIRKKITSFLLNEQFGLGFCQRFIEELIFVLQEFQDEFSDKSSDKSEKRIDRSRKILTETIDTVRKREAGLVYLGFQKDRNEISSVLKNYLKTFVDFRANQFGLEFVNKIMPEIKIIQNELSTWGNKIDNLSQKLKGKLESILDELDKGTQENGKVIFNQKGLEQLLTQVELSTIKEEIEKRIRLFQREEKLDITKLLQLPNLEQVFNAVTYEWVLSGNFPINIKNITFYDKFVNQYPDQDARRKILSEGKNLSTILLKFIPKELALTPNITPDFTEITTIPNFNDNQGQIGINNRPNHLIIQDDLVAIGVYNTDKGNDEEKITFVQETKAFPLRFIESLKFLQTEYQKYTFKDALHINKTIVDKLYSLYLFTQQQYKAKQEAEEVFVFARTMDWITDETNQSTNKKEIRYKYTQSGLSGTQRCVLGSKWEKTLDVFAEDAVEAIVNPNVQSDIRIARPMLTNQYNRKCNEAQQNFRLNDQLSKELNNFLEERLQEFIHDDDPRYQKYRAIINRIEAKLRVEE